MKKQNTSYQKTNVNDFIPWSIEKDDLLKKLNVSPDDGLSNNEAKKRISKYGKNQLKKVNRKNPLIIAIDQFKDAIMIVLMAAAVLSFIFGHWVDGIAVSVALLLNALIGFITELKAVRSMESLQKMDRVYAKVFREGKTEEIIAEKIVPGDILIIEGGDMIAAEARLIEASKLQTNESALTGESVPVSKDTEHIDPDKRISERTNMLFKGTFVSRGTGKAVVTATGMDTEIGLISSLVSEAETKEDPLERRLNSLTKKLIWAILIVAVFVFLGGIFGEKELFIMIKTSVALVIAAIPEGLAIVATVTLAKGMKKMAEKNALVRRLSAVQTLGSTSVIFTDKTGTVTENQITVKKIITSSEEYFINKENNNVSDDKTVVASKNDILNKIIQTGVLCNNAELNEKEDNGLNVVGDPMETALLLVGKKKGVIRKQLLDKLPEIREVSFDPELKMMATFHKNKEDITVAVKGAPSSVLDVCSSFKTEDNEDELTREDKERFLKINEQLTKEGLRILAFATKNINDKEAEPYEKLTFLGFVGMYDPPKKGIKETIESCHDAGIKVIMLTGDHHLTALNVGRATNIIREHDEEKVVESKELMNMDLKNLTDKERERIESANIFSRISPKQKLDIIDVYQKSGSIVAMTGDGVNDAPALKKSNIGIAMGKKGEQVAKETADIILQDDSFSTIVHAIRFGRIVFNNIRNFVIYLLSGNIAEILIIAYASIFGIPLPLLPLQILYINIVNDAFPALALGMGEHYRNIMKQKPRDADEPIMTRRHWIKTLSYGFLISIVIITGFLLSMEWLGKNDTEAVTISFISLSFVRLWHVFNMRGYETTILDNPIVRNRFIWYALFICVILILFAVYVPFMSQVLKLAIPTIIDWSYILIVSLIPLIIGQLWIYIAGKFINIKD